MSEKVKQAWGPESECSSGANPNVEILLEEEDETLGSWDGDECPSSSIAEELLREKIVRASSQPSEVQRAPQQHTKQVWREWTELPQVRTSLDLSILFVYCSEPWTQAASAIKIQGAYRGWVGRIRAQKLREEWDGLYEGEYATRLQAWWRCHHARLIYQNNRYHAILIQKYARRRQGRWAEFLTLVIVF